MRTLAVLALALALTPVGASQPTDIDCLHLARLETQAITAATEGRGIHAGWIEYIQSGRASPEQIRIGGDVAWHQRWVDEYDGILATIHLNRRTC